MVLLHDLCDVVCIDERNVEILCHKTRSYGVVAMDGEMGRDEVLSVHFLIAIFCIAERFVVCFSIWCFKRLRFVFVEEEPAFYAIE